MHVSNEFVEKNTRASDIFCETQRRLFGYRSDVHSPLYFHLIFPSVLPWLDEVPHARLVNTLTCLHTLLLMSMRTSSIARKNLNSGCETELLLSFNPCRIVGDDDGGKVFSPEEYEQYKKRVLPMVSYVECTRSSVSNVQCENERSQTVL